MHSTHDEVDLRLQVARRETVADGVVALELRDPAGAELPNWSSGAHIDVILGSCGEVARQSPGQAPSVETLMPGLDRLDGLLACACSVPAHSRSGSTSRWAM